MIKKLISMDAVPIGDLAALGAKFFAEAKIPGNFNVEHFLDQVEGFFGTGQFCIFALMKEEKMVGALGGLIFPSIFTGEASSIETFWYTDPDHRGPSSFGLLREFETWAISSGVTMIHLAHMELQPDRMADFYVRRGYQKLETVFVKRIWQ
jgi:hypothetical protein